jgi:hypothetical protein
MRVSILVAALLTAPVALAQEALPAKPATPPPAASAAFEQREAWCEVYAAWFMAITPATSASPAPADVRQSHEFEVEFSSCKLDPQQYEQDTREEARLNSAAARG